MYHNRNKKAVSPLIATVLLIAFAVALGAVVMNWGKDYVTTTAQDAGEKSNLELSCHQDIDLNIKEIGNIPKVCSGENYIEIMLENNGNKDIEGVQIFVMDSNNTVDTIDNSTNIEISKGGGVTNLLNITTSVGSDLVALEITPYIKPIGSNIAQACAKNKLVEDDITVCS